MNTNQGFLLFYLGFDSVEVSNIGTSIENVSQFLYFSHLFLVLLYLWGISWRGAKRTFGIYWNGEFVNGRMHVTVNYYKFCMSIVNVPLCYDFLCIVALWTKV